MPRLTNKQYLERRRLLRREWFVHDGGALSYLGTADQRSLHAYFGTLKEFRDWEAVAIRVAASKRRPELPQIAGRAWAELERAWRTRRQPPILPSGIPPSRRRVAAYPLVQPEVDVHRLARLLVDLSRDPSMDALLEEHRRLRDDDLLS